MYLLDRVRESRKRESSPFPCPLYRLPAEGVVQIYGGHHYLKSFALKYSPPTSKSWLGNGLPKLSNLTKKYSLIGMPIHLDFNQLQMCSKVYKQEWTPIKAFITSCLGESSVIRRRKAGHMIGCQYRRYRMQLAKGRLRKHKCLCHDEKGQMNSFAGFQ